MNNLGPEITYNELIAYLSNYRQPRDKITKFIKSGDLIRVKKGLYVLSSRFRNPYSKFILANLIYGPSYVSGNTALSHYGLIPEKVILTTSSTMCRKKSFVTPVGVFEYSLFAGKLAAMLFRPYKFNTKGRDWYDFLWYISRETKVNLEYLRSIMIQLDKWDTEKPLESADVRSLINYRIESLDLKKAIQDVRSFVTDPMLVDAWTKDIFRDAASKIR